MEEFGLKEFFGKTWNQTEVDPHVIDILLTAKSVIDVGCGFNAHPRANTVCDVQN